MQGRVGMIPSLQNGTPCTVLHPSSYLGATVQKLFLCPDCRIALGCMRIRLLVISFGTSQSDDEQADDARYWNTMASKNPSPP
jgi:hypothetical protein